MFVHLQVKSGVYRIIINKVCNLAVFCLEKMPFVLSIGTRVNQMF